MTQDRSDDAGKGRSGKDWDPKKWRPSESFNSTGFSPDSGYSQSFSDSNGRPSPSPARSSRRGLALLIVAIAIVLLAGAAGLVKLVHMLRG